MTLSVKVPRRRVAFFKETRHVTRQPGAMPGEWHLAVEGETLDRQISEWSIRRSSQVCRFIPFVTSSAIWLGDADHREFHINCLFLCVE